MNAYYAVTTKEHRNMNPFVKKGEDVMQQFIAQLPGRIIRHSERVSILAGILAGHVSCDQLPAFLSHTQYISAISWGAYYHEIGICLAGNQVCMRPLMSELLIKKYDKQEQQTAVYTNVILETARNCNEEYNGEGYPDCLSGMNIPIHAAICGIANILDMYMSDIKKENIKTSINYFLFNYGKHTLSPEAIRLFELAQDEITDLYVNNTWDQMEPVYAAPKKKSFFKRSDSGFTLPGSHDLPAAV